MLFHLFPEKKNLICAPCMEYLYWKSPKMREMVINVKIHEVYIKIGLKRDMDFYGFRQHGEINMVSIASR